MGGVTDEEVRSQHGERRTRQLQVAVGLLCACVLVAGLTLRLGHGRLGTALAPLVSGWAPAIALPWLLVGLAGLALLVFGGRRLVTAPLSPWLVGAGLYGLAATAGVAINTVRHGPSGLTEVFDLRGGLAQGHAINEYLPGLPTLSNGVANYLDRFAETVTSQPVNIAGHPPGPLLLARLAGVDDAGDHVRLAVMVIALGALCAPLTYLLARTLGRSEPVARLAGLLCAASPLTLLFGVTSMDYVYAAAGTAAACGLVARRREAQVAGLAALSLAALLSWALLAIGAWAALLRWRTDGWRAGLTLAVACGVAVALTQATLALVWGYDPLGTLAATEQVYRDSLARVRPYWFWVVGSPVAWLLMLGVPIAAGALRGLGHGDDVAVATFAVIAIAALGGFTKAETERIWLFLVPLICVAAAPWLASTQARRDDHPRVASYVLGFLAAQALALQLVLNTVW